MPECARCHRFTDAEPVGKHRYCDQCRNRFREIEQHGVVIEGGGRNDYYITVTADADASVSGGKEYGQAEALARAKRISDETGLDVLFKYEPNGSRWLLDAYLEEHPSVRQDVHTRLRRLPDDTSDGLLSRVRNLLSR